MREMAWAVSGLLIDGNERRERERVSNIKHSSMDTQSSIPTRSDIHPDPDWLV